MKSTKTIVAIIGVVTLDLSDILKNGEIIIYKSMRFNQM